MTRWSYCSESCLCHCLRNSSRLSSKAREGESDYCGQKIACEIDLPTRSVVVVSLRVGA